MKNVILLLLSVCGMLACTHTPKWELVWEDNFDGAEPDTTIWSRIPRGRPDWQNTQSFDNRCYEMPYEIDKYVWPMGGEVDIMERLNYDSIVYQTVHSHYTYTLGIENNPKHGGTTSINPEDFNVYGVDFWPDSLVFHVNGKRHFVYPRIETEQEGQFPFDIPQYLLIDMQLGGTWVGPVDSTDLPVEMEVDWVRHYQWK